MAIKQILAKLMEGGGKKGLTPNEVELNSYLEEERLDRVKALLHKMRIKKNQEILFSNTLVSGGKGVLEAENVITGQKNTLTPIQKKILDNRNLFFN